MADGNVSPVQAGRGPYLSAKERQRRAYLAERDDLQALLSKAVAKGSAGGPESPGPYSYPGDVKSGPSKGPETPKTVFGSAKLTIPAEKPVGIKGSSGPEYSGPGYLAPKSAGLGYERYLRELNDFDR